MAGNVEKTYQERILKVLVYIQNHLDDELLLETLADVAHFSAYHFHRIFTAHIGESVKSYLRRLRLERATRDLLFTELSLAHISERAGYDTQQSFHRAFKETYGTTPKEFRDTKQEALLNHARESNITAAAPEIKLKTIDPISVAFARNIGSYENLLPTWLSLANAIGITHLFSERTQKISIPYDATEVTPSDKIRYDACVSIDQLPEFKPSGIIGTQTLRGGKYAVITHYGPVETLDVTYEKLFGLWLPESGYEPDDFPNFILHHNIPFLTDAKDVVADIYLPIKIAR